MTRRDQQKRQTRQAFFQAVLQLSMAGQAFSSISLRQLTREVDVVPTAFYRHFADMDELGRCLVNEELGHALLKLQGHLQIGKTRTHTGQIAGSVRLFLESVSQAPLYWHFIVSERYGGNQAVHTALNEQLSRYVKTLADDLALQPAFAKFDSTMLALIADMGVNLFFSWVYEWLAFDEHQSDNQQTDNTQSEQKQAYINRCIYQAQILFYGVSNWQPKAAVMSNAIGQYAKNIAQTD